MALRIRWLVAFLVSAAGMEQECEELGGSEELDLRRWRVRARPTIDEARDAKYFGSMLVSVSDGNETFEFKNAIVQGVPWNQPLVEESYTVLRETVRLRDGDVVVATYPKCGTTWMEQMVLLLLHGSQVANKLRPERQNTYSLKTKLGKLWLEPMLASRRPRPLTDFERVASPRLIKTHAPFEMLVGVGAVVSIEALEKSNAKIIYVSRNPKDAAVSHYYQRAPVGHTGRRMPMDAWLALYFSGVVANGLVFDHVASWRAASLKSPSSVLFVSYEELAYHPLQSLRKVASHLGLSDMKSDQELLAVLNASSFEAMRDKSKQGLTSSRRESRFSIPPGAPLDGSAAGVMTSNRFREGKVGGWRRYFNRRLSSQFDTIYLDEAQRAWDNALAKFATTQEPHNKTHPPQRHRHDFGCAVRM